VITDVNLFGLFINAGLVSAAMAALLLAVLRKAMAAVGAYRWLWHPALADVALFLLLWGLVASAETALGPCLVSFLG